MKVSGGEKGGFFGLSRNVFVLGLVSFFNDLSSEMVYPLFPTFLTEFLGAGAWFLGLVEGLADSVASLFNLFSGWLSDRLGRRKGLVAGGYSLSALARGSLALVNAPWQALAGWFLNRVGKGIRTSPRDALIADSCHPAERGRAFGYHRSMDHTGALFGAALASVLLAALSLRYRGLFALAFAPIAVGIFFLLFLVRESGGPRCEGEVKAAPPRLTLKPFDRRFKMLLLAVFIFTLGNSSDAFLILRAQNVGIKAATIPIIIALLNLFYALLSVPAGMLSDKIGRAHVIRLGWLIYGLVYLGFALARAPWHIWALYAFYGVYYASTEGVAKSMVAHIVDEAHRGTAFGLYNASLGLVALPASVLAGYLWDKISPSAPFYFGAACAAVAVLLLTAFHIES